MRLCCRYKSQTHGDDQTEEQKDEVEFRQSFPVFDEVAAFCSKHFVYENNFYQTF